MRPTVALESWHRKVPLMDPMCTRLITLAKKIGYSTLLCKVGSEAICLSAATIPSIKPELFLWVKAGRLEGHVSWSYTHVIMACGIIVVTTRAQAGFTFN